MLQIIPDLEVKNKDGNTALHIAAIHDKIEVVKQLLNHGANYEAKNNDNLTPLQLAQPGGEVAKQLQAQYDLFEAAKKNFINPDLTMSTAISNGASVNAKDHNGDTPLHHAVSLLDDTLTNILIQHGAHIDAQNIYGQTPLHLAAHKTDLCLRTSTIKDHRFLDEFVKNFPNKTIKDSEGKTAYDYFKNDSLKPINPNSPAYMFLCDATKVFRVFFQKNIPVCDDVNIAKALELVIFKFQFLDISKEQQLITFEKIYNQLADEKNKGRKISEKTAVNIFYNNIKPNISWQDRFNAYFYRKTSNSDIDSNFFKYKLILQEGICEPIFVHKFLCLKAGTNVGNKEQLKNELIANINHALQLPEKMKPYKQDMVGKLKAIIVAR
jgi:hypothetical protein